MPPPVRQRAHSLRGAQTLGLPRPGPAPSGSLAPSRWYRGPRPRPSRRPRPQARRAAAPWRRGGAGRRRDRSGPAAPGAPVRARGVPGDPARHRGGGGSEGIRGARRAAPRRSGPVPPGCGLLGAGARRLGPAALRRWARPWRGLHRCRCEGRCLRAGGAQGCGSRQAGRTAGPLGADPHPRPGTGTGRVGIPGRKGR